MQMSPSGCTEGVGALGLTLAPACWAYLLARDRGEAGPPLHLVQMAQVLADGA